MDEIVLNGCSYLGGCGYPLAPGNPVVLRFGPAALSILLSDGASFSISYVELASIEISGPGTTTTGGGFIGGGFGVQGALEGMAIASVLNALTTKSKIHTFVSLTTNIGEIYIHYGDMEPSALRIALSPVYTAVRRLDPEWHQRRLGVLQHAQAQDSLLEHELSRFSERLIKPITEVLTPSDTPTLASVPRSSAHLSKARSMRSVGLDQAHICGHLQSIGLSEADAKYIVEMAFSSA